MIIIQSKTRTPLKPSYFLCIRFCFLLYNYSTEAIKIEYRHKKRAMRSMHSSLLFIQFFMPKKFF